MRASSFVESAGVIVVVLGLCAMRGVERAEAGPAPGAAAPAPTVLVEHDAAIAALTKRCEPTTPQGGKKERADAFREERDCLERALRAEIARATSAAPRVQMPAVRALAAQAPVRSELRETLCDLEEELFWVDFAARWRRDGTMRGDTYASCVIDVLREQNYFWQALGNDGAADFRRRVDEGLRRAPYVAGVLSDVGNAANSLLARKVLPGRRERNFTGWALGPSDFQKLAAVSRKPGELAGRLAPDTCTAWPELRSTFATDGDCTHALKGYYLALSGMLDDGRPRAHISLEETPQ